METEHDSAGHKGKTGVALPCKVQIGFASQRLDWVPDSRALGTLDIDTLRVWYAGIYLDLRSAIEPFYDIICIFYELHVGWDLDHNRSKAICRNFAVVTSIARQRNELGSVRT